MPGGYTDIIAAIKTTIEALTPTVSYLRTQNLNEANVKLPRTLLDKPVVIHTNLSIIEHLGETTTGRFVQQFPIEILFAQKINPDATAEQVDLSLNTTKDLADQFADRISLLSIIDQSSLPFEYSTSPVDSNKVLGEVLTGWMLTMIIAVDRANYTDCPTDGPPPPDSDADAIIAAMPNALVQAEENAITVYVSAEKAANNWLKFDSLVCMAMQDADNSLTDWIKLSQMVNNGATHSVGIGYDFDGVDDFINTLYNPIDNGVKYLQNDAMLGIFVVSSDDAISASLLGAAEVPTEAAFIQQDGSIFMRIFMNEGLGGGSASIAELAQPDTFYHGVRSAATVQDIFKNGIIGTSDSQASSGLYSRDLYIAALNQSGTSASFYNGTLAFAVAGGGIGIDFTAHNTNVRNLLTALAAI